MSVEEARTAQRAAENADWRQVIENGGPPCFHMEKDGMFCLRAERWQGHVNGEWPCHGYVSLVDLLKAAEAWGLREAARIADEIAKEVGGEFADTHRLNTGLNKFRSRLRELEEAK